MLRKKELPEQGEFVIIKINKVTPHGAYCKLEEYGMDAYLPISEVASGWIKNIHEFIREGQQDVAKVIFLDTAKNAVDISLKKVSQKEKKDKINDYSSEKRAKAIFDSVIKLAKKEDSKEDILSKIPKNITTYHDLLTQAYEGSDPLAFCGDKTFKEAFYEAANKNIKPKTYTVSYNLELIITNPQKGIDLLKTLLKEMASKGNAVRYLGAPHYSLISTDSDYAKAEARIKNAEAILSKHGSEVQYVLKKVNK
jgi:translation initiation factor 2 subunit 1